MKSRFRFPFALLILTAVAASGIACRQAVPSKPVAIIAQAPPPPPPPKQTPPKPTAPAPAETASDNPDALPPSYRGKILREHPPHFDKKLIALTFDDGPDPRVTPKVLKDLAEYNAHATFFVVGKEIPGNEKLLKRMVAEGHVVGNHTYSHPAKPSAARARTEIARTETLITKAIGHPSTCFRPPYGFRDTTLTAEAKRRGYGIFLWTIDPGDTRGRGTQALIRGVLRSPEMGDIVILHDGNNHQASAAAVTPILDALTDKGWKFVTIPEMMAAWEEFRQDHPKSAKAKVQKASVRRGRRTRHKTPVKVKAAPKKVT